MATRHSCSTVRPPMPESNMPIGRARSSAGSAARSGSWPARLRSGGGASLLVGTVGGVLGMAVSRRGCRRAGESPHALLGRFAESEVYRIDPGSRLDGRGSTVKPGPTAADTGLKDRRRDDRRRARHRHEAWDHGRLRHRAVHLPRRHRARHARLRARDRRVLARPHADPARSAARRPRLPAVRLAARAPYRMAAHRRGRVAHHAALPQLRDHALGDAQTATRSSA